MNYPINPAVKLQAAIEKLERLRHDSAGRGAHGWAAHSMSGDRVEIRAVGFPDGFFDGVAVVDDAADADLILTLHRTIDAQLRILRGTAQWIGAYPTYGSLPQAAQDVVALASAILGEES